MAEVVIDIADQSPKILIVDAVQASDGVIMMGCGGTCPIFPGKSYRDWVRRLLPAPVRTPLHDPRRPAPSRWCVAAHLAVTAPVLTSGVRVRARQSDAPLQDGFPPASHVLDYLTAYETRCDLPVERPVRMSAVRRGSRDLVVESGNGQWPAGASAPSAPGSGPSGRSTPAPTP